MIDHEQIFTFHEVVGLLSAEKVSGSDSCKITGISIDSRRILPGDLFIGIQGAHHHGDQFIDKAIQRGAKAIIISTEIDQKYLQEYIRRGIAIARVNDGLDALVRLAQSYRAKLDIPIIAITGSCGKTTTKEMLYRVLDSTASTFRSYKNYNNHIGVSLSLLQIRSHHRFACLELGTNGPGEIPFLASLVQPHVGVVLNVAPAHLEKLIDLSTISREKWSLIQFSKKGVFNLDDPYLADLAGDSNKELISFAIERNAQIKATHIIYKENECMQFQLHIRGKSKGTIEIPFQGRHYVSNFLAVLAVVDYLGVDVDLIKKVCSDIKLPEMRWEVKRKGHIILINDAYNANPQSMAASLESFKQMKIKERRFFVCGDMLELGPETEIYHRELGLSLKRFNIDCLITMGQHAEIVAKACLEDGVLNQVLVMHEKDQIIQYLKNEVHAGDAVLVKGSRLSGLEAVVDAFNQILDSNTMICI